MTEIIAENPQNTSPSLAERLASMRAEMDERARAANPDNYKLFSRTQRATSGRWSFQKKIETAIRGLDKRARRHAPSRHVRLRPLHAQARARRSPASQRRATTDSGGDPEPEPPRRNSLAARRDGGAL